MHPQLQQVPRSVRVPVSRRDLQEERPGNRSIRYAAADAALVAGADPARAGRGLHGLAVTVLPARRNRGRQEDVGTSWLVSRGLRTATQRVISPISTRS